MKSQLFFRCTRGILLKIGLLCAAASMTLTGCQTEVSDDGKPEIICTLFPQYDFARQIYGDQADVTMILPPGTESHMFDPTPEDMAQISDADVFIYTGDEMEPWAAQIAESLDDTVLVLDLSQYVTLEAEAEHEHEEGILEEAHEHSYDPHYWLDLDNAQKMAQAIAALAPSLGIEDTEAVESSCERYTNKLQALDQQFFDAVDKAERTDIVFAGRFAYSYFLNRYGLSYETVYHSCSAEADPGVAEMMRVIDYIQENDVHIIFYEELSSGRVAQTIAEDTGAATAVFSTAHNVSKEEFDSGITFTDIMENNLKVLKEAIGSTSDGRGRS